MACLHWKDFCPCSLECPLSGSASIKGVGLRVYLESPCPPWRTNLCGAALGEQEGWWMRELRRRWDILKVGQ